MKLEFSDLAGHAVAFSRTPRARKIGWWIFGIFTAVGILGAVVAPLVVRSRLERELTQVLHRNVTIEKLRINPYALSVTVSGLRIHERDGGGAALAVEELYANASSASLFRLAPVLSAIRVTRPQLQVVRVAADRYNWSDLIDEFINKPRDPNEPPARFALANIEIVNGDIAFDDRPQHVKHVVSAIQLAVPFVSSLSVYQEINVEPRFSASVNGTPVELVAKAKPFKPTHDSSLNLDIRGLDLTRYLEYVPGGLPVKLTAGRLDADLDVTFAQPKDRAPTVVLSGKVALAELDVREPGGDPILKLPRLAVDLRAIEPLMRRFEIAKVAVESPEMRIRRRKGGEVFLLRLFAPKASVKKPAADAAPAAPLSYKVDEIALTGGKLEMLDERGARPVTRKFDEVRIAVQNVSSTADASGRFDVYGHTPADETLALSGDFGLQPLQSNGTLKLEHIKLPALWPYVEPFVALDAADGELSVSTAYTYSTADKEPSLLLKDLETTLRSLVLQQRWDKQELLRVPTLSARGVTFDLRGQTVTVGDLSASGGRIAVRRDRDGVLNVQKLAVAAANAPAADAPATPPPAGKPWSVTLKSLALEKYAALVEDELAGPAATAHIENLSLKAANLSTDKGQRGTVALRLALNKTGTLAVGGPVTLVPPSARLKIDARSLGIVPVQPYFERFVNAIVSSGDLTASGDAEFELPEGKPPRGSFKGAVTLANFSAVNKTGSEDLLRWKTFAVSGIDATLEPLKVAVAEVALTEFFSRLVVTPAGRLNLQDVFPGKDAEQAPDSAPATAAAAAPAAKPAATPTDVATGPAPDIQIGKITLAGGNVNFSDFFIKPNYSANLTDLEGSVTTITRDAAGDVDLRAKIDHSAPVEIAGKVNPLAKDLFLDLKANATDIELAPLTPYAAKYAGYGIEKGKLSMKVAYKLENRKLSAQNKVILNQLTFGEKVESPTATKLPVLFAVSLLKDRNGVIDIDLPVSGSIDDPQFSVGGIIGRVILNLLVKIVTSPFALIGSLFGGNSDELAYIEFTPGEAKVPPAGENKLKTIAKALTDRPALKLDIAGRVDPEADREGLRKTSLERKVKAQKLKDTVKGGAAAGALDQVIVEPAEYPKYLAKAYGEEKFDKPRNLIGLAKTLPVPEMEQLMITNAQVTEEDLRQLANQRAQAVKDYLVETSKVPADRVFLLASKLSAEGIKDKGKPTRVDFSLK